MKDDFALARDRLATLDRDCNGALGDDNARLRKALDAKAALSVERLADAASAAAAASAEAAARCAAEADLPREPWPRCAAPRLPVVPRRPSTDGSPKSCQPPRRAPNRPAFAYGGGSAAVPATSGVLRPTVKRRRPVPRSRRRTVRQRRPVPRSRRRTERRRWPVPRSRRRTERRRRPVPRSRRRTERRRRPSPGRGDGPPGSGGGLQSDGDRSPRHRGRSFHARATGSGHRPGPRADRRRVRRPRAVGAGFPRLSVARDAHPSGTPPAPGPRGCPSPRTRWVERQGRPSTFRRARRGTERSDRWAGGRPSRGVPCAAPRGRPRTRVGQDAGRAARDVASRSRRIDARVGRSRDRRGLGREPEVREDGRDGCGVGDVGVERPPSATLPEWPLSKRGMARNTRMARADRLVTRRDGTGSGGAPQLEECLVAEVPEHDDQRRQQD